MPAPARRRAETLDLLAGLVSVALLVLVFADRVGAPSANRTFT